LQQRRTAASQASSINSTPISAIFRQRMMHFFRAPSSKKSSKRSGIPAVLGITSLAPLAERFRTAQSRVSEPLPYTIRAPFNARVLTEFRRSLIDFLPEPDGFRTLPSTSNTRNVILFKGAVNACAAYPQLTCNLSRSNPLPFAAAIPSIRRSLRRLVSNSAKTPSISRICLARRRTGVDRPLGCL
jgi:hypothetical protein